jgi:hypothetical protein
MTLDHTVQAAPLTWLGITLTFIFLFDHQKLHPL